MRRAFCIAPMMDWTDRHERYFLRLISRQALLYTEMVTAAAIIHGDRDHLLGFDRAEHPLALQLGGSDPVEMGLCARIGADYGYDEININVGCPSDRVQSGRFGACLLAEPQRIAACVAEMCARVDLPVTVKTRVGVDDRDRYEDLTEFVATVAQAGCQTFVIHARKAWLSGLSPKENREVPPLCHDRVHHLKKDFPDLEIVANGGIKTLAAARGFLQGATALDGVMVGRAAYQNPYLLAQVDQLFYDDFHAIPSRQEIVERFIPYLERQMSEGVPMKRMVRHLLGLFQGVPGAKRWRRILGQRAHQAGENSRLLREALTQLPDGLRAPSAHGPIESSSSI